MGRIKITVPKSKHESVVFQRAQRLKREEIIRAVNYCKENGCRGWKCIKDNDFQYLQSPLAWCIVCIIP